jgi:hypothetical protein
MVGVSTATILVAAPRREPRFLPDMLCPRQGCEAEIQRIQFFYLGFADIVRALPPGNRTCLSNSALLKRPRWVGSSHPATGATGQNRIAKTRINR